MREKWIDNAKGLAMLMVIVGHVSGELTGWLQFNWVYGIHLVVFFLISGYTMRPKTLNLEYINKKFSGLMIPYFWTGFFVVFTDIINSYVIQHNASIQNVTNIIFKDINRIFFASGANTRLGSVDVGMRIGAIWFLPAMFFSNIIFQILLNHIQDDRLLALCSAGISYAAYLLGRFIWLPFSIQSAMYAIFFIWIGYFVKKHNIIEKIKPSHYVIAVLVLLIGIKYNYCNEGFVIAYAHDVIFSLVIGVAGCILVYFISKINKKGKLLEYMGKHSLIILCFHLYALETMGEYFNYLLDILKLEGNVRVWMFILMEMFFAVAGTVVFNIIMSKVKKYTTQMDVFQYYSYNKEGIFNVAVFRGVLLLGLLISSFAIDAGSKQLISTMVLPTIVILSGYEYSGRENRKLFIMHSVKYLLIPYCVCIFVLLLGGNFLGRKFSGVVDYWIAGDVGSPACLFLILFGIKMLFLLIDVITKTAWEKGLIVLGVSTVGFLIGSYYQSSLPLGLDLVFFMLIFYQIGIWIKEYNILKKVVRTPALYFVFSSIWAYMIYLDKFDVLLRRYGQYGVSILGTTAACLLIYQFVDYIGKHLKIVASMLRCLGNSILVFYIFYVLFFSKISDIIQKYFHRAFLPYMIICGMVFIVPVCFVQWSYNKLKRCKIKMQQKKEEELS